MYWHVAKEIYDLKDFSIFSSGSHVVQLVNWGEGKMRTISVKLF